MFKLSRKGEYALRTIFHLSIKNEICTTAEIAKLQGIPQPFLKKIIQALVIAGVISSTKGLRGGIKLVIPPKDISVKLVIEGVEGPIHLNECLLCSGTCPRDQICPLHEMWNKSQGMLMDFLDAQKFDKLVQRHVELVTAMKESGKPQPPDVMALMNLIPKENGSNPETEITNPSVDQRLRVQK